jgi:hypothetical protein
MKHKTYKIQKGDTLESISKKLNITLFELRNFHNNQCELNDLVGSSIPKHLKFILIPVQENRQTAAENQKEELKIELKNNSLSFNPDFGKQITYEVSCTLQKGNTLNNLHYLIKILPEKTKEGVILSLSRDQVYINGQEADLQAEDLALHTIRNFYPVQIKTNQQGQLLGINNQEELRKQWKKQAQQEKYPLFTGKTVEKYQKLVQETTEEEKQLYQSLLNDLFIAVFFNSGIYTRYTDFEAEQLRFFPIQSFCAPAEFTVRQTINPIVNQDNFIEVKQEGTITDLREKEDFENKGNFSLTYLEGGTPESIEGYLRADYLLHPLTHVPESVELECRVQLEETRKIQVKINNLEKRKAYYLPTSRSMFFPENDENNNKKFFLDEK